MNYTEQVHIVAAGRGSRLRNAMDNLGYGPDYPKHLLPTGNHGEVLLGRIARQAVEARKRPTIYACENNIHVIQNHPNVPNSVEIVRSGSDVSFFGPLIRSLLAKRVVVLGVSGDHYVELNPWADLLDTHDSSQFPVTFAAARGTPMAEGLSYTLRDNGQISGFRRKPRTSEEDLVNTGLYVISPAQAVMSSLGKIGITETDPSGLTKLTAEVIAAQLVVDHLVGVHELPAGSAFNVNDPDTYRNLLAHTQGLKAEV